MIFQHNNNFGRHWVNLGHIHPDLYYSTNLQIIGFQILLESTQSLIVVLKDQGFQAK